METTLPRDWATQPPPKTKKELQEAIAEMLAEMERVNVRMDQNREAIDRLAEETQARLDNISRLLAA